MADLDLNPDQQDPNVEEPGDTNSADIVGRTGEQMPLQSHDGIDAEKRDSSTRVNDEDEDPVRDDDRHDNPRPGRTVDW
jgi:hypothetical protein